MKLHKIINKYSQLTEMAKPAKICDKCGKQMTGHHYWYKGGWKCKGGAGAGPTPTQPTGTVAPQAPSATPAPVAPVAKAAPAPVAKKPAAAPSAPQAARPSDPDEMRQKITNWLNRFGVKDFTMNEDLSVVVNQDVHFDDMAWPELPVNFAEVNGDFLCIANHLVSMKNTPRIVHGDFNVSGCNITSLEGMPETITGDAVLSNNPIDSFEHLSPQLGGSLNLTKTSITTLSGIHKVLKKMSGTLDITDCKITGGLLGLLLVRGLKQVEVGYSSDKALDNAVKIINRHLEGERDIQICQEELIDAGLSAFAKL